MVWWFSGTFASILAMLFGVLSRRGIRAGRGVELEVKQSRTTASVLRTWLGTCLLEGWLGTIQ